MQNDIAPRKLYDNDQTGVPRIPEISVGKYGVILNVISNEFKGKRLTTTPKAVIKSDISGFSIPSKLKTNKRGKLQLYRFFQKKAMERKTKLQKLNF